MPEPDKLPTIDPTANVLKLVEEAVKRIDDLRKAESHRVNDLLFLNTKHIKDIMKIHLKHESQLRNQEQKHADELRTAEAKRIDAINAGSVQQLATLATQVTETAETLRKSQEGIINQINDRIAKVEQVQYKTEGKTGVTDPMMEKLLIKIDSLIESRSNVTGQTKGRSDLLGWIFGAAATIIAILTYLSMKS